MPFLHTFSSTGDKVLHQKFEKVPKSTQNMPKTVDDY